MRSYVVALTIMLAAACGGKTSDGAATTPTATATIGTTGGTLTSTDGQASITIPAGALPVATAITIAGVAAPTIPHATVIGPAYRFGPAGTKLAPAATIAIPYGAGKIGMEMYFSADGTTFTVNDTWTFNGGVMSAQTQSLGTFVVAVPDDGTTLPSSSSSSSTGGVSSGTGGEDTQCVVMCEGPTNADGGIGCDCSTTCHGVTYRVDCRCGECTCTQNGFATSTVSAPISACDNGGTGLISTYTSCNYPYAPSQLGAGGPTSGDAGGHCE